MNIRTPLKRIGAILVGALVLGGTHLSAQQANSARLVQIAELEIDPAHLDAYKIALRTEIEASIRLEPGVLVLYAVSIKDHPAEIRLFEVYSDTDAYQAHLHSEHFLKYKSETAGMVRSLKLLETTPILLGSKKH